MAIIHPRLSHPLAQQHGGYKLELNLLELLRMGLPDNFDVFHGLTWSTVHSSVQKFGELDLTVVSPQGQILILEVKAGSVYTNNGLLFKDYRQEKPKDIGHQPKLLIQQFHKWKLFLITVGNQSHISSNPI